VTTSWEEEDWITTREEVRNIQELVVGTLPKENHTSETKNFKGLSA
jgi:hypothetical protein